MPCGESCLVEVITLSHDATAALHFGEGMRINNGSFVRSLYS